MLKHKDKLKRCPPMACLRKTYEEPVEVFFLQSRVVAHGLSSKCCTATSWQMYVTNIMKRAERSNQRPFERMLY